jgi:hypothetical protein
LVRVESIRGNSLARQETEQTLVVASFQLAPGERAVNQLYNLKIYLFALGVDFMLTEATRDTMLPVPPSWPYSGIRDGSFPLLGFLDGYVTCG